MTASLNKSFTQIVIGVAATAVCGSWGILSASDAWRSPPALGPSAGCEQPWDLASDGLYVSAVVRGPRSYLPFSATDGRIVALFVSEDGAFDRAREQIEQVGGRVLFADPVTGYVRASVPLEAWPTLRCLSVIRASQLDGPLSITRSFVDSRMPRLVPGQTPPQAPPRPQGPQPATVTPEPTTLPTIGRSDELLGITHLRSAHPTLDGRGVTIAFIEARAGNLDVLHPAFSSARDLSGQRLPKIADWIEPDPTDQKPFWWWEWSVVHAESVWDVNGHDVMADGHLYVVPAPGRYNFGRVEFEGRLFSVLWNVDSSTVWIDINGNRHFEDETPIRDARQQTSHVKLPSVHWPSGVGISVLLRGRDALALYSHVDFHVSMAASVAAGAAVGQMSGIAPAARLVLASATPTTHGYLETLLRAAQHPDVDLLSISMGGGEAWPQSPRALAPLVIDRIVEQYGKPVIEAAGNNGAVETTGKIAERSIVVGAFDPHDTIAEGNAGIRVLQNDWIRRYSSGSRLDGGRLKPDVVAPTLRLAAATCGGRPQTLSDGRAIPDCYAISSGTSTAAPMVSGVVAALLSGAKATGLQVSPADLTYALRASARYLDGWPAHEQGSGIPQADVAWRLLQEKSERPAIRMRGAVQHVLGPYKEKEIWGGVIEREGWAPGQAGVRQVQFERTSGPSQPLRYTLRWIGNNGTFATSSTIELPLGTPVTVPVRIRPATAGIHSARLRLGAPGQTTPAYEADFLIVAAPELNGVERRHTTLRAEEHEVVLFKVPPGRSSLDLDLTLRQGTVVLQVEEPAGWKPFRIAFGTYEGDGPVSTPASRATRIVDPAPGVWAVVVDNSVSGFRLESKEDLQAMYDLTIRSVAAPAVESVRVDGPRIRGQLRAHRGAVSAVAVHTALTASPAVHEAVLSRTPKAGRESVALLDIQVPQGATALYAAATFTNGDPGGHLYVFDCTGDDCRRVASLVPGQREQKWYLRSPSAGRWRIAATPGPSIGDVPVRLTATYAHPQMGRIEDVTASVRAGQASAFTQVIPEGTQSPVGGLLISVESSEGAATTPNQKPQVQPAPVFVRLPQSRDTGLPTEERVPLAPKAH